MPYQLSHDELVQRLQEQLGFLRRSADAYDAGYEDEAKRLAVVIRVLLHDTRASRSVLGLLGVKSQVNFLDTAMDIVPTNLLSNPGLVMVEWSTGDARYLPPLDNLPPFRQKSPKPFDVWWKTPVTKDNNGKLFGRKDYVLNVANKEGGAHVDPQLTGAWANLTRDNSLGWSKTTIDGPEVPLDSPALASIRQIAYEVDESLRGLDYLLSPKG